MSFVSCAVVPTVLVLATALAAPAVAEDLPVDLELVLAVDVSGSMDPDERQLQRSGYVAALRHADVIAAIRGGAYGRVALTFVEWAGPAAQSVIVPWRQIDGAAAAEAVAAELSAASSASIRGTSISSALLFAASLYEGNGFAGSRRAIDVSGDGPNNMGPPVAPARDVVVARGIVINGLPIMLKAGSGGLAVGLDLYYKDCVIGGPGAFVLAVHTPKQLAEAIRRKLVLEVAGRPPAVIPAAAPVQAAGIDCLIGEKTRPLWFDQRSP
jgi:hypothetical protein